MTCHQSQKSDPNVHLLYYLGGTNHIIATSFCELFVVAIAFSNFYGLAGNVEHNML